MSFRTVVFYAVVCVLICLSISQQGISQVNSSAIADAKHDALRDGQHDFDFDIGVWKTHSSRLLHPLTGSTMWADMDGLTVVKKVWDGRANLAEYKADGPSSHVEFLALRYYNPDAHQWGVVFATPGVGTLSVPCIGEFRNGRGDFYAQEELNGKYILVRCSIWRITEDTAQSEQAFSDDGGKTWEVNWVNKYARTNDQTDINWTQQDSSKRNQGRTISTSDSAPGTLTSGAFWIRSPTHSPR